MKRLRLVNTTLIFLLFLSCSGQGGGVESQQELLDRVREAVEKKDADAIMRLGYWENVPDSTKEGMQNHLRNCFDYQEPSFNIRDMSQKEREAAEAHGKTYVWNMEPVAYLVVKGRGAADGSLSIPIGKRDGRYYVASRLPKE